MISLPPEKIVLAECPDFSIGPLRVRPPLREIEAKSGAETIEPRVMQVLVALWRSRSAVVSRSHLIDSCWDGRVIGDDAVHRCIARVRRIGEAFGAFRLTTIARVGYRLEADITVASELVLALQPVVRASDDPSLAAFAAAFEAELSHALTRAPGLTVLGRAPVQRFAGGDAEALAEELGATHALSGAMRAVGQHIRVTLQLVDIESGKTIARKQIDADPTDFGCAPDDVAHSVARALGVDAVERPRHGVPPQTYADFSEIRQIENAMRTRDLTVKHIGLLETWTTQFPRFAAGWGMLACCRAYLAEFDNDEDGELSARARTAAHSALALDPRCSDAYIAISIASHAPDAQIEKVEAAMRAVEFAPSDPAANFVAGAARMSVGHTKRALGFLERGQNLDPGRGYSSFVFLTALHAVGRKADAAAFVASLDRDDSPYRIWARFFLALENGDWIDARSLFAEAPEAFHPPVELAAVLDVGRYLKDLEPAERRSTLERLFDAAPQGTLFLTAIACNLGEANLAFARLLLAIDSGRPVRNLTGTNWAIPRAYSKAVLFDSCRAPLVADPRFPTLAARLGLTRFWIETQDWPDCAEGAPYDFRALCLAAEAATSQRI
jgi:TolB-like protein